MRRRPAGVVNAAFWELPNAEAFGEAAEETFSVMFGSKALQVKRLCEVKHTITRFRMVLQVFHGFLTPPAECKLLSKKDLRQLPLVNAHRKALIQIGLLDRPK